MNAARKHRPDDRFAYIGIGFYVAVYLAFLFLGSKFGNFAICLFDSWVMITGLAVFPVSALAAMSFFQLTDRSRRFSWVANTASLFTILASWFALFYAMKAAAAAV